MHASLEDLLSLRDGDSPPRDWVEHVAGCGPCTQRLAALCLARARLRALPRAALARDLWPQLAPPRAVARRSLQWAGIGLAAAASAALLIFAGPRARLPERAGAGERARAAAELSELRAVSQQLGQLERSVPRTRAVVSAREESALAALELAIASVDGQLTDAGPVGASPAVEDLWRQRVELMNALVQVRFAQGAPAVR